MKFVRYGIALVLTIALLGLARRMSTRHATEYSQEIGDNVVSHSSVTEDFGNGPLIEVEAANVESLTAVVYYSESEGGPYLADTLTAGATAISGSLPVLPKGRLWYYHVKVTGPGQQTATFPPRGDQFIKFKGHVPPFLLIPHIFCMFAIVFLGLLTVFSAYDLDRGRGDTGKSVRYLLWTVIFAFVGGFPLGYYVAYLAFGVGWSGIPFGWDITDNKTVVLFAFWLLTLILARKGLKGEEMGISKKTYLILTAASLVITIITFMIPHSI